MSPVRARKKTGRKRAAKKTSRGRSGEAKALLAKMKAKKDAGECAFC